jgi:hypothetical protein
MAFVICPYINYSDSPPPNPIGPVLQMSGIIGVAQETVVGPAYRAGNSYVPVVPAGAAGVDVAPVGYAG